MRERKAERDRGKTYVHIHTHIRAHSHIDIYTFWAHCGFTVMELNSEGESIVTVTVGSTRRDDIANLIDLSDQSWDLNICVL